MNLRRGERQLPLVIGHRGAAAVAPENTLASLVAAVDAGVDVVEFDVGRELLLEHSDGERPADAVSLDDALAFLAEKGVAAHVDLKADGLGPVVAAAVQRHGLAGRAYVSAAHALWLRRLAAAAPELPRAIGYPRDRFGLSGYRWPGAFTTAGAASLRAVMPARVRLLLRAARADVLSLHCALVTPAVVAAAHRVGAPLLAWTANDPTLVLRLAAAGVDGIVSDDPGMVFETLATLKRP